MKHTLLLIGFLAFSFMGCKKALLESPSEPLATLSFDKLMGTPDKDGWSHVLGGTAILEFKPVSVDSVLSAVTDTIDLKNLQAYTIRLAPTTYAVSLITAANTNPTEVFVRFQAEKKSMVIEKDQLLSFDAITTDGVITVAKTFANAAPTFKIAETGVVKSFSTSGNFYFLYVKNGISGRVEFTEPASGEKFYKTLTVAQKNRYNITAAPDKQSISTNFTLNITQTIF